jgi:hypothetical protein
MSKGGPRGPPFFLCAERSRPLTCHPVSRAISVRFTACDNEAKFPVGEQAGRIASDNFDNFCDVFPVM